MGVPGPMRRSASLYSTTGDRKSVVDQWVTMGSRSQTLSSTSFSLVTIAQSLNFFLSPPFIL